ncbi:hypothetical protein AMAG_03128 [Allomyces macrogynus ATCC 38327]|uniref:Uncharacterized protein n=1 Tax=Allomyces macrogynus (strain ATCC 38327) TaxID=578462 RepID=A0A0L0S4C8_ALLM3|nr:hypothetical protein AMAG_03128 [Allomyces macrogynus ATCC 38327]|eukprot:KNE57408.1 hypothetical protein AMAG_03128 [Allomyces macrogynus ATCC 38327]
MKWSGASRCWARCRCITCARCYWNVEVTPMVSVKQPLTVPLRCDATFQAFGQTFFLKGHTLPPFECGELLVLVSPNSLRRALITDLARRQRLFALTTLTDAPLAHLKHYGLHMHSHQTYPIELTHRTVAIPAPVLGGAWAAGRARVCDADHEVADAARTRPISSPGGGSAVASRSLACIWWAISERAAQRGTKGD